MTTATTRRPFEPITTQAAFDERIRARLARHEEQHRHTIAHLTRALLEANVRAEAALLGLASPHLAPRLIDLDDLTATDLDSIRDRLAELLAAEPALAPDRSHA